MGGDADTKKKNNEAVNGKVFGEEESEDAVLKTKLKWDIRLIGNKDNWR